MSNLIALLRLVFKRLRHNLGLSASTLIGILSILTVAVCVPIFSHAVSADVLRRQLQDQKGRTNRPLFSLRFSYHEKINMVPIDIEKCQAIAQYLRDQITTNVGVPVQQIVMDLRSSNLVVTDMTGRWPEAKNSPLGSWTFLVQDILPEHARITEGFWPGSGEASAGPIQVAVPVEMADEMMLQIGDHFLLDPLEVVVVGFWKANDPTEQVWFNLPTSEFSRTLWVPRDTFLKRVSPRVPSLLPKRTGIY